MILIYVCCGGFGSIKYWLQRTSIISLPKLPQLIKFKKGFDFFTLYVLNINGCDEYRHYYYNILIIKKSFWQKYLCRGPSYIKVNEIEPHKK
eukprot:UN00503